MLSLNRRCKIRAKPRRGCEDRENGVEGKSSRGSWGGGLKMLNSQDSNKLNRRGWGDAMAGRWLPGGASWAAVRPWFQHVRHHKITAVYQCGRTHGANASEGRCSYDFGSSHGDLEEL